MPRAPKRFLLLAALLVLLPSCAASGGGAASPPGQPRAGGTPHGRYQATGTVLENQAHGPELCLGAIAESYPPQCGGLPLPNWDWDQVEGEERAAGTTWGSYTVVGTYDGTSFRVERAGPPGRAVPPQGGDELSTPCPEPAGGWQVPDPARATSQHLEAAIAAARAQPDFAGAWVSYPGTGLGAGRDRAGPPEGGTPVLNVAFTGDLRRHEARLRGRWGGPLCLTRYERTHEQLVRIQNELTGAAGRELGLQALTAGVLEHRNAVALHVVTLDERARAAIDERYGKGTVQVTAALTPVPAAGSPFQPGR